MSNIFIRHFIYLIKSIFIIQSQIEIALGKTFTSNLFLLNINPFFPKKALKKKVEPAWPESWQE